jgi:glycosyltransferase involved in cell wall biosynthesis
MEPQSPDCEIPDLRNEHPRRRQATADGRRVSRPSLHSRWPARSSRLSSLFSSRIVAAGPKSTGLAVNLTLGAPPERPPAPILLVLQTVSPDYRQAVWRALMEHTTGSVLILAGARYFDPSIVTRHEIGVPLHQVGSRYFLMRRVLIQRLPFGLLLSAQDVIAELNPRILTTWMLLCMRRLLRRRTVLWGHAFSRIGRPAHADWIRQLMRHLANTIVVYTENEREALASRMPHKDIVVAPNGLLSTVDMVARSSSPAPRDFIYVGRLIKEKRPDLLVEAFVRAIDSLASNCRLLLVGDGPLRDSLEGLVAKSGAEGRVRFCGHVGRVQELRDLYGTALAGVSPGYAGLSITQSFGFGVPMIIADREPHSPEIEAADPTTNCVFFTAGSAFSLASVLIAVDHDAAMWLERSENISQACRSRYSAEGMAAGLLDACRPASRRTRMRQAPTRPAV